MVVEDQIQLMSQRIGGQRFEGLLSRLDVCGSAGDALWLLRSSESFRGLVERQKMRDHSPAVGDASHRVAMKYGRGGIVDIEFVVQYLVLNYAARYPDVRRWSDVVRILEALAACKFLSSSDANSLKEAYLGLWSSVHRAAVSNVSDGESVETDELMKQASAVCRRLLPNL